MHRHTQQIGGVTVTFTVGHVNELRAIPGAQTGEVVQAASPDWWLNIPGIPADWPAGVLSHEVEPKA
jgi:hypothetical protein